MGEFFRFDGKFMKYGTLLADLIILTLLWSLTSLPIITLGASTTALYYVTTRQLSNREGYVTRDYFKSFKQNFFQATIATVIFLIIGIILFININYMDSGSLFFPLQLIIIYEVTITAMYFFPVLARFDMKTIQLFKTAFFLANRHLFTTITNFVLLVAMVMVCMRYGILIIVCAGLYAIISSFTLMHILKKYLPELDTDDMDIQKANENANDDDVTN